MTSSVGIDGGRSKRQCKRSALVPPHAKKRPRPGVGWPGPRDCQRVVGTIPTLASLPEYGYRTVNASPAAALCASSGRMSKISSRGLMYSIRSRGGLIGYVPACIARCLGPRNCLSQIATCKSNWKGPFQCDASVASCDAKPPLTLANSWSSNPTFAFVVAPISVISSSLSLTATLGPIAGTHDITGSCLR